MQTIMSRDVKQMQNLFFCKTVFMCRSFQSLLVNDIQPIRIDPRL